MCCNPVALGVRDGFVGAMDTSPKQRVDNWLASFESALRAGDVRAAADLFAPDGFWRDLVAFTWNITTVEGPEGVRDLLTATLEDTDPRGFRTTEEPTEADGTITAWIEFETAVGRGRGLLRLQEEGTKAFTLLTTLYMMTIFVRAWFPVGALDTEALSRIRDPGAAMTVPLLVLAAAGVVLALLSDPLTAFLQAVGLNML